MAEEELQAALNSDQDYPTVERFGYIYRPGDKVMQTNNDYDKEVFNGDIGYVDNSDPDAQEMTISFDGRPVLLRIIFLVIYRRKLAPTRIRRRF